MSETKKTYDRSEIDQLRENIGHLVWVRGTLSDPDLDICIGKCTGVKVDTADFRLEKVLGGLPVDAIRPIELVFLNKEEVSEFLTNWNKEMGETYGFHGYDIVRVEGRITINPIRMIEDEWTGKMRIEYLNHDDCFPVDLIEDDLIAKGHIVVKNMPYDVLNKTVFQYMERFRESDEWY